MRKLTNPDAIPAAVRLYEYICSLQGKKCLTGQMESGWCGTYEHEMNYLLNRTGCLPAIRGLDFINNDFQGVVRRAMDWHARGGIVTICWHTGPDFASSYRESQEKDLDWEKAFTPGTVENHDLIVNMDRAVPYLQQLCSRNIPVLWRPFHEFDGKWFWWGRGGEEGFIKLWRMMYDRYTNIHRLHNLIWVLGYSDAPGDLAPWYPGDDVVDILGGDSYKGGAQGELYRKCAAIAPEGMPICYHENGEIPTRAQMEAENAPWVWFMTWHTRWITTDEFNTQEKLHEVFRDDHFVKLHQVEDFITQKEKGAAGMKADAYLFGQVLGTHSFLLRGGFLQPDEYSEIDAQYFLPGGETGTAATVLSSLGVSVRMAGTDIGAKVAPMLREFYKDKTVDLSRLNFVEGDGVMDYVVIAGLVRSPMGRFQTLFSDGSRWWGIPQEEDLQGCRAAAVDPFFREESDKAAEICVRLGIPYVTIDSPHDSFLHQHAAVNVVSGECLHSHYQGMDKEKVMALLQETAQGLVIITSGGAEMLYGRRGEAVKRMKPFPVEVRSTLGAGDTFKAGCVYGLLEGMDDDAMVRFASACSGIAISRFPLPLNPPRLDEVKALIARGNG